MEEKHCGSCGAPMAKEEMYGTEKNGSRSKDYCVHCYDKGAFLQPDITLDEMITFVSDLMVTQFGFTKEDADAQCKEGIPTLKRWNTAK